MPIQITEEILIIREHRLQCYTLTWCAYPFLMKWWTNIASSKFNNLVQSENRELKRVKMEDPQAADYVGYQYKLCGRKVYDK